MDGRLSGLTVNGGRPPFGLDGGRLNWSGALKTKHLINWDNKLWQVHQVFLYRPPSSLKGGRPPLAVKPEGRP